MATVTIKFTEEELDILLDEVVSVKLKNDLIKIKEMINNAKESASKEAGELYGESCESCT